MALRQLTPEEQNRLNRPAAPSSIGTGANVMKANPRSTPASQAAASVPKTYETPPTVQAGQSQSQLRSLTNNEAVNIQKSRDTNYGQNTNNPALTSNPRDMQIASGGGVQQAPQTIGGTSNTLPLSFGDNLPKTSAAQTPPVQGQITPTRTPTGQSGMIPGATQPAQPTGTTQGQPGGTMGQEGVPTGAPETTSPQGEQNLIDQTTKGQLDMAGGVMTQSQQLAQQTLDMQNDQLRYQAISALSGTNAQQIAESLGVKISDMSLPQLESLLMNSGIEPSKEITDRIQQDGAAAINDIKMEQGDLLAANQYTADQVSRAFNRQITDTERMNLNQDAKLKKMMAIYGGGSPTSMSGNKAIMMAEQKGQQMMNDLTAEYGGRMDNIGRQAQAIIREGAAQTRQINNQVQDALQAKKAEIQQKAMDIIAAGVTNQKDFNTAMASSLKDYAGLYNDITKWGAEQHIEQQKTMFDQAVKLRDQSMALDKQMSDQYGVVFQNGQPVMGTDGQPVSTLEATKFATTEDRLNRQLEQDAQQFSQRLGFDINKEQFSQMIDQARFSQGVDEFNQTMGLNLNKFEYEQIKDAADRQMNMADKGLSYENGPVDINQATSSINPAKSKYGIQIAGNGITINAPINGTKLASARRQCGEYTNDALGIPNYFGDTIAQKSSKVTTQIPSPGSAFVLNIKGVPQGHVGVVEQVNPDGTLVISESNYDGNENFRRITTTMDALQKRGLVGFTGGLSQSQALVKKPGDGGKQLGEAQVKMLSDAKFLPEVLGDLDSLISGGKASFGPIQGNLRTLNPYDTDQKAADASLRRARQLIGSFMEGGVLRKEDEEKYANMLPKLSDTRDVAQRKLDDVKHMLQQKREGYINDFAAAGYDTSGLKDLTLGNTSGGSIIGGTQRLTDLVKAYANNPFAQ